MTKLDAGERMKIAAHVAEALATLSAIRLNTPRAPRSPEYIRHLERLEVEMLSITSRLLNVPPQDEELEGDLRAAVNLVYDLKRVELVSVGKNLEAALLKCARNV